MLVVLLHSVGIVTTHSLSDNGEELFVGLGLAQRLLTLEADDAGLYIRQQEHCAGRKSCLHEEHTP